MECKNTECSQAGGPRARAYDGKAYMWNFRRIPASCRTEDGKPHPARRCGVFVVHGVGVQQSAETAAVLRSGFEDAVERIKHECGDRLKHCIPPPFCYDGTWADYEEVAGTFTEDWQTFCEREQAFFGFVWKNRMSLFKTALWAVKTELGLLRREVRREVGAWWYLYIPLGIVSIAALLLSVFKYRQAIGGFIQDLRLYAEPHGTTEKAIVQRIDYRVGEKFLRMIGLGWDFRPLGAHDERLTACGEVVQFEKVTWVAHSLGSVISYNVLSDLFSRASTLLNEGDREQKEGVGRFCGALQGFVTMGSPLDKFAFLFPDALRPWKREDFDTLLPVVGTNGAKHLGAKEWWVNFYSVFDPASGALGSPLITGVVEPRNMHSGLRFPEGDTFNFSDLLRPGRRKRLFSHVRLGAVVPGYAHISYWSDADPTLRYILGRTFEEFLHDSPFTPVDERSVAKLAVASYLFWAILLLGLLVMLSVGAYASVAKLFS